MFVAIEINLILWLMVFGSGHLESNASMAWTGPITVPRELLLVGCGFAAIVQHWAYYALYRQTRLDAEAANCRK